MREERRKLKPKKPLASHVALCQHPWSLALWQAHHNRFSWLLDRYNEDALQEIRIVLMEIGISSFETPAVLDYKDLSRRISRAMNKLAHDLGFAADDHGHPTVDMHLPLMEVGLTARVWATTWFAA